MLDDLYKKAGVVTRMISAENPTGEKGKACLDVPDPKNPRLYWSKNSLGENYKVCPFIRLAPRSKTVLADHRGSGVIRQIFMTSDRACFSELVLRIWFDDSPTPSVECPLGAFFCIGHDSLPHNVYSLPVVVAPHRGCNCYWPMPFAESFRVEVENQGETTTEILAYRILFHEQPAEKDVAYFHAQYRRTRTTPEAPTHVILDDVQGKGVYVGTYLAWTELHERWWGEGEVKFYLDGDADKPTICDNGTEDYFGGAWNFGGYGIIPGSDEQTFHSPYLGLPLAHVSEGIPKRFGMYRFHIEDCIGFEKDIKVTVDTIGWKEDFTGYEHHSEDVRSVAFYYKQKPFTPLKKLDEREKRYDISKEEIEI